jgi:hypothetical protein
MTCRKYDPTMLTFTDAALATLRSISDYYDDCAGDPTCPATGDQIAFFVVIVVVGGIGLFLLGSISLAVETATSKLRESKWDGRVHAYNEESRGACGQKLIKSSKGPDVSKDPSKISCKQCLDALRDAGWDGLVHAHRRSFSYESVCGLEKPSYRVGVNPSYAIDLFVNAYSGLGEDRKPILSEENFNKVTCEKCKSLIRDE